MKRSWIWLAVTAAAALAVLLAVPAAGAQTGTTQSLSWSAPVAFDFGDHTYHRALTAVACPSTSLCVAADDQGNVVSSTDPGDVAPTWTMTNVAGTTRINGISCASTSLCVAVDDAGDVMTSTDPSAASSWATDNVDGTHWIYGISCPSTSLCAAVDNVGNLLT